jgi:phosphatidylinositol glycan class P protein
MRDATGIQTPNSAAASALNSTYRNAETIPRASPKVPTYEYYGFTLYLTSSLAFIVYVLWAFLPSPLLHQLGIYYYPNRWWALAIPAWTVMLVLYIYVALAAYNLGHLTLPLQSIECLVDEAAQIAVVDDRGQIVRNDRPSWRTGSPERGARGARGTSSSRIPLREGQRGVNGGQSRTSSLHRGPAREDLEWRSLWKEGTDAVMDIPIGGVCEILYGGPGHDDEEGVEG